MSKVSRWIILLITSLKVLVVPATTHASNDDQKPQNQKQLKQAYSQLSADKQIDVESGEHKVLKQILQEEVDRERENSPKKSKKSQTNLTNSKKQNSQRDKKHKAEEESVPNQTVSTRKAISNNASEKALKSDKALVKSSKNKNDLQKKFTQNISSANENKSNKEVGTHLNAKTVGEHKATSKAPSLSAHPIPQHKKESPIYGQDNTKQNDASTLSAIKNTDKSPEDADLGKYADEVTEPLLASKSIPEIGNSNKMDWAYDLKLNALYGLFILLFFTGGIALLVRRTQSLEKIRSMIKKNN